MKRQNLFWIFVKKLKWAKRNVRARPEVSPLVVLRVVDLGLFGGELSGFAEEGEGDLDLFWGEDFAGAGVAGGLEGGEEGFVGMDFVGEAFACTLLTFGDVA